MTNCKSLFVNCTKRSRQKSDFFFVGAFGFLSHQKAEKSFRQEMPGTAAEGGEKHTECAVPAGTNFPKGKLKVFLPYFLYFTKSRKKKSPQGGAKAAERQKNVAAATEKCRRRRQKDLIGFVRSRCFGCADSRFEKPRNSR